MPQVIYTLDAKGNLIKSISEATEKAKGLDDALGNAKNMANSLGSALGVAFGVAGIALFTKKVIEAGTTVEDATTGLTTLLGSAAEAAEVVKNTMEDATKTPFAFEGLLSGNKALISAGASAKQAREDVLNLANAIAATGGGDDELQRMVINMQQIKNVGVATAQDIKQFGFAGINIYKVLAEATGKSIAQVKEMPVTYELLTEALKKAHQQGGIYFNGLENMAGNTSVKISNVGDALFQTYNKIFTHIKPLINGVLDAALGLIGGLTTLYRWFSRNKQIIADVAIVIGAVTVALGIHAIATNAAAISFAWFTVQYYAYSAASAIATTATWAFSAALWSTGIPEIVIGVAALVAGIIALTHRFGGLGNMIKHIWSIVKSFAEMVKKVFIGVGDIIVGALTLKPSLLKKGLSEVASAVKDGSKEIADAWNDTAKEPVKAAKTLMPDKKLATGKTGPATEIVAPEPKTKAEGSKNINIHVAYNAPLIKDFTISTTNIKEGFGALKEKITEVLTSATHDSVMIADI